MSMRRDVRVVWLMVALGRPAQLVLQHLPGSASLSEHGRMGIGVWLDVRKVTLSGCGGWAVGRLRKRQKKKSQLFQPAWLIRGAGTAFVLPWCALALGCSACWQAALGQV